LVSHPARSCATAVAGGVRGNRSCARARATTTEHSAEPLRAQTPARLQQLRASDSGIGGCFRLRRWPRPAPLASRLGHPRAGVAVLRVRAFRQALPWSTRTGPVRLRKNPSRGRAVSARLLVAVVRRCPLSASARRGMAAVGFWPVGVFRRKLAGIGFSVDTGRGCGIRASTLVCQTPPGLRCGLNAPRRI